MASFHVGRFAVIGDRQFRTFQDERTANARIRNAQYMVEGGWQINRPFYELHHAIEGAKALRRLVGPSFKPNIGVSDAHGNVLWQEGIGHTEDFPSTTPQEGTHMGEVPVQPLNVEREQIITTLQQRAAEEQAKREEANAAALKRRQAAQDAITSLSPDELLNLVLKQYHDLDDIVDMVKEAQESGRLKSVETKESSKESAIGKWVRILEMSTDKTIEVTPTDSLYGLL